MRMVLPMSRIREMEPYMDAKVLNYIHEGQIEAFEIADDKIFNMKKAQFPPQSDHIAEPGVHAVALQMHSGNGEVAVRYAGIGSTVDEHLVKNAGFRSNLAQNNSRTEFQRGAAPQPDGSVNIINSGHRDPDHSAAIRRLLQCRPVDRRFRPRSQPCDRGPGRFRGFGTGQTGAAECKRRNKFHDFQYVVSPRPPD